MLQQYFRAKAEHPGVLLAMRVGDFYEFYGEDAEKAAATLEIVLTAREDGGSKIPMAGVPFHAVERYLARLVAAGHKVALCDQLEDPKAAKGLVKRGVTRVLTPGTLMEDAMLSAGQNNFLAAICVQDGRAGLAVLDSSTGEFVVTEVEGDQLEDRLLQELARIRPSELLVGPKAEDFGEVAQSALGTAVTDTPAQSPERAARRLLEQFHVTNLQGFGCEDKPSAVVAASMILSYADQNHLSLAHVDSLATYSVDGFMRLDAATRRSLELTQNMADGSRKYTLLSVLDATVTAMGSRLMRRWIEQALVDAVQIRARHNAVDLMLSKSMIRGDLREALRRLSDIERLVARTSAGLAGPRDLAALRSSLAALPEVLGPLRLISIGRIEELRVQVSDHSETSSLLERALVQEPPHTVRDGGVIRPGYDLELDKLRDLSKNGKRYIADLEQQERVKTGISNLKVGFNSVFGYYLEVSKSQIEKAPPDYIRKQTTANAERFITAELKEHESLVLGAQEKAVALESDLFNRLRLRVAEHSHALLQTARALSEVDVLAALAEAASQNGYVKPEIVEEDVIDVKAGRHAVVESNMTQFVPNDVLLGVRDEGEGGGDAGRATRDAGEGGRDAGRATRDAGEGGRDAGRATRDAGEDGRDAGRGTRDAGEDGRETGRGTRDEGEDGRETGRGTRDEGAERFAAAGRAPQTPDPRPYTQKSARQTPDPLVPPQRLIILTGPNMSGKSTYLRQTALIVLMAQIGSYVPAKEARIGLCDRIFARIGAKDELALGQSTFMVEMIESANILNHATARSLVILDEVGRGTSTYDGLAIAWAMVEHLAAVGAKTMFATHYHQLNALAEQIPGIGNFRVSVEEFGDDIVWTHRVLPGGTDRSYGIHVARMAGVPQSVLARAAEVLADLEETTQAPKAVAPTVQRMQLSLFELEPSQVEQELSKLDVNRLTPIEALKLLDDWKRKFGKGR
jgi:DNA mismatch repair protein MutS